MLTRKQYELLIFINRRLADTGVSPSFEEMKEALALKSKSGIHRLISGLEERGFIRRLAHRARALEVVRLPEDTAVAGRARAAGRSANAAASRPPSSTATSSRRCPAPPLADGGESGAAAALWPDRRRHADRGAARPDEHDRRAAGMLGSGEHYALEVAGDSMIDAGIFDGDTVLIQRCDTAENGAIVVALVDNNEVTLEAPAPARRFDRARARQQGLRDPHLRPRPGQGAGQAGGAAAALLSGASCHRPRTQGRVALPFVAPSRCGCRRDRARPRSRRCARCR